MLPIFNIDLTSRTINQLVIPKDWERDYLGAASLAARILYDYLTPELVPISPEAPLLFITGPLTGTAGPAVGRFVICAKSPATGLWGESHCGGFWGPELRKAGFSGLLVTGRAETPVYLWICDGEVEIRDATHLWGMDTCRTQEVIVNEVGQSNPRVAVIGPAGEIQIPMSTVMTDHGRVAGRTGMGAVMGSKNLKAIAVKGSGKVVVVDGEYAQIRSEANRVLRDDNFSRAARETGTAGIADYLDYLGESPKKYFGSGIFPGVDSVTGATMAETILTGVRACHACVIACGRVVQLKDETRIRKGPEYETIMGFGPNLYIDDLAFITRMSELCDRFGIDTISLSNTIGLAFSLYEKGQITTEDTGGLGLEWGNKDVVEDLLQKVFNQEGIGAYITEGARAFGRRFQAEEHAVQVNGLEVAYHDPRGASGMALVYATSPRGACHNQSDYFLADIYGMVENRLGMKFMKRHVGAEKAVNVAIHQNWRTVFNSLIICYFANVAPQTVLELVNSATGYNFDLPELLRVGERAWNLKRVINNRLGLNRKNDRLPKPLLESMKDGGSAGYQIPFDEMIEAYYQVRGWSPDTGYPTYEKLVELGLEWVEIP
jgi:aldehyde:ferredoxin oxidoreductase